MASNGDSTALNGSGIQSFTTRNKQWRISTRKAPILKAEPIDQMNEKLRIPVPEMIFGDNFVAIEHESSGWKLNFNSFDALDRVSKSANGMLQVAYSKEWQKDRYALTSSNQNTGRRFDIHAASIITKGLKR